MRIIAGKFRGRQLRAPGKLPVRPTTDQAKEALFNILSHRYHWSEIRTLDLYAGTGNVSFEFASRGVTDLTCVDQHPGCIRFIRDTFGQLGVPVRTVKSEVGRYVRKAAGPWDLIFMDPPYGLGGLEVQVQEILHRGMLAADGTLVLEHPPQENYSALPGFEEMRKYGSSVFSFFGNVE